MQNIPEVLHFSYIVKRIAMQRVRTGQISFLRTCATGLRNFLRLLPHQSINQLILRNKGHSNVS